MSMKRKVILAFSILLLSIIAILSACGRGDCSTEIDWYAEIDCDAERGVRDLLRQIEQGNLDDITLRIYTPRRIHAWAPFTGEEFANRSHENRVVVEGVQLEEHIDLLRGLRCTELVQVEKESILLAFFY